MRSSISPRSDFQNQSNQVDVIVPIHEGRQYFFGNISFSGQTVYGPDALRGQISDLLQQPYTDVRVEDIPRRLQEYFKRRGYYDVKVEANGAPEEAVNGRVPVDVSISTGPVYHFDGVSCDRVAAAASQFCDQTIHNIGGENVQPGCSRRKISDANEDWPVQSVADQARAGGWKFIATRYFSRGSQEQGIWFLGSDSTLTKARLQACRSAIATCLATGRADPATIEVSQRSYRGEILYEDPFFFDTNIFFRARASAFTFDYDGYSKFELGGRLRFHPQNYQIRRDRAGCRDSTCENHRLRDPAGISARFHDELPCKYGWPDEHA